jgi:integrase
MRRREIIWKLVKVKNRSYVMRYRYEGELNWRQKSTGKTRRRDAISQAAKLAVKLTEAVDQELHGWSEFRYRYETEHLSGHAAKSLQAFQTAANRLEELCRPETIEQLTSELFSRFALRLRQENKSEATIDAYRAHLLAACRWACNVELIDEMPKPPRIERAKAEKSRGRPLNREEAERIAMQLPKIVGQQFASRWAWNLEGLWRSGMRIGETMSLFWEPTAGSHWIDQIDSARPRIVISAESEKGFRDRILPMTPDFVRLLRNVPQKERHGAVFRWTLSRGDSRTEKTPCKRIAACGKAAGVITGRRSSGKVQHATAHDFRRSFGDRWSMKVMPVVLQTLMRHASISTTMKYYVGRSADRISDQLWQLEGDDLGDMLDCVLSIEPSEPCDLPANYE